MAELIRTSLIKENGKKYIIFNSPRDMSQWLMQNSTIALDNDRPELISTVATHTKHTKHTEVVALYFNHDTGEYHCQEITSRTNILNRYETASLFRPKHTEIGEFIGDTGFVRFPNNKLII
ncbi:MAG TPA: hypothetical protein VK982_11465, partial [Bacteroidales bacterium]|nr:hypothetical protein [Bacteroidales bacterium]